MAGWDRRIYKSPIVRAMASFGSHEIAGAFFAEPRELNLPSGAVQAVGLTFECHYEPAIAELTEGDMIDVDDYGPFRFLREVLPGGDESGLTIIELGTVKA